MFIIAFILVISIVSYISNKTLDIDSDSEDSYSQTKRSTLFYIIVFIIGLGLQVLSTKIKFIETYYWYILALYVLSSIIISFVLSQIKKQDIEKKREELLNIYQIVKPLADKKGTELDFNNVPFELDYKYGNVNKITIQVEPTTFKEATCSALLNQLNAFLPTFTWNYKLRLEERCVDFIGYDKPPEMARWPGSWLRHFRYMPLGISGLGEIAYQPDGIPKNEYGRSQYLDNKGNSIRTDDSLPTQPQGLIAGAPLGLDTIIPTTNGYKTMRTIEVGDYVFDINNKPVKVLGKSDINYNPDKVYELTFTDGNNQIIIISDSIHRFPKVVGYHQWHMVTADELKINDNIFANKGNYYQLIHKEEVEKQPVQCILVDSNEHLFLITDKEHIHSEWKGGNSYPYEAVYTRNTGGGKSVTVQNAILHCIEHRDKIALALIDPKMVEFSNYKGMKGIVGVANSTQEAVELLRISRAAMKKRNTEMMKMGIKNLTDYKPHIKTGKVFVTGRDYNEDDIIKVRIDGQEQQMTASELVEYLRE